MKVAVIPARGGSKRIPKKNTKDFCGRPIMAYSIEAAQKAGVFDEVIVSTDDPEIAEVARKLGASVPFLRPAAVSDDHASILDVMRHTVDWYKGETGADLDYLCLVYATAPFVQAEDLRRGLDVLKETPQFGSSMTVAKFTYPVQRALRITSQGELDMIDKAHLLTRSQDLEEAYMDAAQFIWSSPQVVRGSQKSLLEKGVAPVEIPTWMVQDIDTMEDWVRAELLYRTNQQLERHPHGE